MVMKVGSEDWNRRYDGFSKMMGLNTSMAGFGLAPAYEAFCLAELELFDQAIVSINKDNPLMHNFVEELRGTIADPIYASVCFRSVLFPSFKRNQSEKKTYLETLDQTIKENAVQAGYPLERLDDEGINTAKKEINKRFNLMLKGINSVLAEEKKLSDYDSLNKNLAKVTNRNYENRLIYAPPHVVMAHLALRNEIYREALDPQQRELLWFGPSLLLLARKQNILENSMKLYDFKKTMVEYPELASMFDEKEMAVSSIGSGETKKVKAIKAFEEIIPNSIIPLNKLNELEATVMNHFHRRLDSIFSEK